MNKILIFTNNLNLAASTLIAKLMFKLKKAKLFQNINTKIKLFNNLLIMNIEVLTLW
jgi:hypothetical protein